MPRRIIVLAGLAAIMVVLAAYPGLSHGVRAWFAEGSRDPTEAAQERTLATKHAEIRLPAELVPEGAPSMAAIPFIDDFEGPWPGAWQERGMDWDRVDCNSHSPTHSASASGDPTCTTYRNNQNWSGIVYGPFDLTGAAAGGVQFWFDLDTMDNDWLLAFVSIDGNNWCGRGPSGDSAGWTNSWPGFAPWDFGDPVCPPPDTLIVLGQPQVWFAFIFRSDDALTGTGAWVDDVCIWRDDPSVCGGPPPVIEVDVDIKPGSDPNSIKLSNKGVIPLAILSTSTFDARTVDPSTVCFGDNPPDPLQSDCTEAHATGHIQDVDGDTDPDLVLHYETGETGIDPGDIQACLTGQTFGGAAIQGCDAVRTLP
ncbi:MAG: hypothetical protein Q8P22_02630 [Chloroflexota bacterium]|nr:hypothetical protein [Chloroflexota bacterium]